MPCQGAFILRLISVHFSKLAANMNEPPQNARCISFVSINYIGLSVEGGRRDVLWSFFSMLILVYFSRPATNMNELPQKVAHLFWVNKLSLEAGHHEILKGLSSMLILVHFRTPATNMNETSQNVGCIYIR